MNQIYTERRGEMTIYSDEQHQLGRRETPEATRITCQEAGIAVPPEQWDAFVTTLGALSADARHGLLSWEEGSILMKLSPDGYVRVWGEAAGQLGDCGDEDHCLLGLPSLWWAAIGPAPYRLVAATETTNLGELLSRRRVCELLVCEV